MNIPFVILIIIILIFILNVTKEKKNIDKFELNNLSENVYLIGGLPRTRTAWMSIMLSYQNAICLHEPIKHFKNPLRLKSFIMRYFKKGFKYVGISCSTIYIHRHLYKKLFPKAKFIFIRRKISEVEHSLNKLNIFCPPSLLNNTSSSFFDYTIDYNEIDSINKFKKLWYFIYQNNIYFDKIRYKDLCDINISIIKHKWEKKYKISNKCLKKFN